MKRTLLICCFVIVASLLNAQKIYFIYLQTESGIPFFIRINDKLYSSTSSGYLILSRLIDSTYNFKLGFPGKDVDLDFTTTINKKDHGYLIKDFGEKGWGLFDLQSLSIQMSSSNVKSSAQLNSDSNSRVNAFTDMLSKATDDPSLKQNAVFVKEQEKKPAAVQTLQREEKKPDVTEAVVKDEKKSETIVQSNKKPEEAKTKFPDINGQDIDSAGKGPVIKTGVVYKKSNVIKISGMTTVEGFESVFIDEYQNGSRDTVRILIPGEIKPIISEETKPDSIKDNKKFLDVNPDTTYAVNKSQAEAKKGESKKLWPFNKNKVNGAEVKKCQIIAGNDVFLKLRRKMAGRTNDDGMLEEAKKFFRTKCFTSEQIKNLSSMFLSNAGKYNFFNVAYNYVSDKDNFSSLQSELKDEYYINQFKVMLRN